MKDSNLLNQLWCEVAAGRVSASMWPGTTLTIFKYTQKTIFEDSWNEVNLQARGIVFDIDGTIVARPFGKFFNAGECGKNHIKDLPWGEGYTIYEKMDGSCGIGYNIGGKWRLATPGSLMSDQALIGTKILNSRQGDSYDAQEPGLWIKEEGNLQEASVYALDFLPKDCTPVFEIIYPENRIVVDYDGQVKLVLLAVFDHDGTEWHDGRVNMIAGLCGFERPEEYTFDPEGEIPFADNSEGYVIKFGSGLRVKIKSPIYIRIHRLLDHLSPKRVIDLIRKQQYDTLVNELPPEIVKDFDDICADVHRAHKVIELDVYEAFGNVQPLVEDRRLAAEWITEHVRRPIRGLVFNLMDGKSIQDAAWKVVLQELQ